ncbi:MAG TPA: hypothetical protein PLW75_02260 [Hyphomicrobium sp.]|nr:hypothetical protein [Hyphomicrobium sp.]
MSTPSKSLPTHRVSFSAVIGHDEAGEKLSKPVECGTVWARKSGKGAIMRLDVVPEGFGRAGAGVIFLNPVTKNDRGFA